MKRAALVLTFAALAFPGAAAAGKEPLGQHVSECAQMQLPPADPPAVVCDGHTFANFGEMVRHMLQHHG